MTRIARRICFALMIVFAPALALPAAAADERITVTVPPDADVPAGVTVKYSVPPHVNPVVILFGGDNGVIRLTTWGWSSGALQYNFLIRSRHLFNANDLQAVMLDAASNRFASGLDNQRLTAEHAKVVKAVIANVRTRFPGRPVWLVGTSNGTLSVANAAARLGGAPTGPNGIVLTSTITVSGTSGEMQNVFSTAYPGLGAIHVPTFVVWHSLDACPLSLGGSGMSVYDALTGLSAAQKGFASFSGGGSFGPDCQAQAYHGFNGIEDNVITRLADFIKSHMPPVIVGPPPIE